MTVTLHALLPFIPHPLEVQKAPRHMKSQGQQGRDMQQRTIGVVSRAFLPTNQESSNWVSQGWCHARASRQEVNSPTHPSVDAPGTGSKRPAVVLQLPHLEEHRPRGGRLLAFVRDSPPPSRSGPKAPWGGGGGGGGGGFGGGGG